MRAVDCQGFAGGFTLGTVQAGFELVGKREMEPEPGFGVPNVEANRHLLGDNWQTQVSAPEEWEPVEAEFVFGNPPCSGFSLMSSKHFRGPNSPVNACMWAFASYVARVQPQVAAFESVQQAFSGGRELMQQLRTHLEQQSGLAWHLYHVKHNNLSCGGAAVRPRYFWVVSRIPFGVEIPEVHRVPQVSDVFADLDGLALTWLPQPYRRPATWWTKRHRADTTAVDGHQIIASNAHHRRLFDLLPVAGPWMPRESHGTVARRYYEITGTLPPSWSRESLQKAIERDWNLGFNQTVRWAPDRLCRVITGAGCDSIIHPWEERPLTFREVARVMGYPDSWVIQPLRHYRALRTTWGKGIPVESGKWIASWVRRAIDGEPGAHVGEEIGERENLIDVGNVYRPVAKRQGLK